MTRSDYLRICQHFWVGVIAAWLTWRHVALGVVFSVGFYLYEYNEDWKLRGSISHIDIMGFLIGLAVMGVACVILAQQGLGHLLWLGGI